MTANLTLQRRWYQITLRTLLLWVAIAGVAFGWCAHLIRQASQQREVVEKLRALGAIVRYDYEYDSAGQFAMAPELPGPAWIRKLFGVDLLANVVSVYLDASPITDADLKDLRSFDNLQRLSLDRTRITDAGLVHIAKLHCLTSLELSDTDITDAGLAYVEGLTKLERLWLEGTRINGSGLVHLHGFYELQSLRLDHTHVSDDALMHLLGLKKLVELWLQNTKVTDSGCAEIERAIPHLTIHR
jgi:hypothetical protein